MDCLSDCLTTPPRILFFVVALALVMLPVAVRLNLVALSERNLSRQASNLNGIINGFRGYYAANVVARAREAEGNVQTLHNHHQVKGAIPVPATLSIELGETVHDAQNHVGYRFVSDYPFLGQPSHDLPPLKRGRLLLSAAATPLPLH